MTKKRQPPFSVWRRVKLELIEEPAEGATVLVPPDETKDPIIRGSGSIDRVCGRCGFVILDGMRRGAVQSMVFKCGGCGAFNRINDDEVV